MPDEPASTSSTPAPNAASHGNGLGHVDLVDFVRNSARLLDLALTGSQVERVASHLVRTRALAATLSQVPLAFDDEPAEIFRPAPFPAADPPLESRPP